jgi:hypothetical protein
LTEGILNKIAGKVMGQALTHKYKVGDDVSYEMDPPQEGGRGKGKITSVSKAGDHYTVNGKFVNHFEIKKKHASVKESKNSTAYAAGYDAFLADVVKNPHPAGSDDNREWNLGWEAAQSRSAVSESFNEPTVVEGLSDTIKRSVKKLTAPVKDPILDQMKSIADTANKRARAAQNVKYASKAVNEAYTGHFNDDDWYEVDPKTNTVLRHAGGHADYRPTMLGQPIKLPNGNVLMRGMCAKDLRGVTEAASPFRKGDTVTITADSKYKGEKCKVLSVDRGFEMLEVTMIKFPGSHIRSDWRNFSKAVNEQSTSPEYKSIKYKQYTVRQEGPKQWAIVGATVNRFGTLLAAKNYIDKRL